MTLQKIVSIIIKLVMLFMLFLYGSMFLGMFVSSLIEKKISENSASSFSIMGSAYPLTVVILAIAASDSFAKILLSKYPPLAREFSGYIKNTYVYMMPTAVIKLVLGIVMIKSKRTISKWVMQ